MKVADIQKQAYAMPLTRPSYPKGPYRFINREYLIITYETDMDALKRIVPEPLEVTEPVVKFEFIRMPDSTGFGDYTESGQVIPVQFQGEAGGYVHAMYLDVLAPIVGGREIWGFPKKLAKPVLQVEQNILLGKLSVGNVEVAIGSMGYKHAIYDIQKAEAALKAPGFLIKIIPHVDGSLRICELVRYQMTEVTVKGAWTGPAALSLFSHAMAPVADLPVKRVISGIHILSDLTLPYGEVVYDYLAKE